MAYTLGWDPSFQGFRNSVFFVCVCVCVCVCVILQTNQINKQTNQPSNKATKQPINGHRWKHNLLGLHLRNIL